MLVRFASVAVVVAFGLVGGCYTGAKAPPANAPESARVTAPGVSPRVRITEEGPDDGDGGQRLEGAPPFAYEHLPAVSVDRSKIAVVEERDGWGHTSTPGVRILDATTGRTHVWLPLVDGSGWPADDAAKAKKRRAVEGLVSAANAELARTGWHALAEPGDGTTTDAGGERKVAWTLGRHTVTLRYAKFDPDSDDARELPTEILVVDDTGRNVATVPDVRRRWAHNAKCASPSFKAVGIHAEQRVMVFHQEVGRTSHACDGIDVPDDWRILRF